jgi:hypothetical protein
VLVLKGCCCSTQNWGVGDDSVQVSDQRRAVAMVADEFQAGLQELEAGLRDKHASTSHVSLGGLRNLG